MISPEVYLIYKKRYRNIELKVSVSPLKGIQALIITFDSCKEGKLLF